jgi:hypothetical protein
MHGERVRDYYLHVPNVMKPGSLSLLKASGPVQACNGIALPYLTSCPTSSLVTVSQIPCFGY